MQVLGYYNTCSQPRFGDGHATPHMFIQEIHYCLDYCVSKVFTVSKHNNGSDVITG